MKGITFGGAMACRTGGLGEFDSVRRDRFVEEARLNFGLSSSRGPRLSVISSYLVVSLALIGLTRA